MTNLVKNELQLVESKDVREQYINKVEVLDKVKKLVMLPDNTYVTVEMVAEYYEVGLEGIKSLIKDNREELEKDNLKVLTDDELRSFKNLCQIKSRSRALTIIPRRAILRIGMLLRDSKIAKQVRSYLLNIEQIVPQEIKNEAMLMLAENRENFLEMKSILSNMSSEIKFLHMLNNKLENELLELKNNIKTNNTETNGKIVHVDFKVDGIKDDLHKFTSRINYPAETNSSRFEDAKNSFCKQFGVYGATVQYSFIHKAMQNWLDVKFPNVSNIKHYVLEENKELINIDIIEQFVQGVLTGRIIKSKADNWYDSMGVPSNNVEWKKILRYFNNTCAYCGVSDVALFHEHMVPQSVTGSTNLAYNSVCSCGECNREKNNQTVNNWYRGYKNFSQEKLNKIVMHYNRYLPKPIM